MQAEYERGDVKGWTQWSRSGAFRVGRFLENSNSGCDVGLGFFAAVFAAAALAHLHNKSRGTK
jgi:hypothetical protein